MINLLKFEFRNLWQQKSLYIVFGIGLVSIVLAMMVANIFLEISHATANATEIMVSVLVMSNLVTLLGVYLALFVCNDFSQHTIKNIYARGYSRSAVYFSKYIVSLLVTIVVTLLYMAFGFLVALILGGYVGDMPAGKWGDLALQLWVVVGLHGLFFGVSMMVSKIAGSLALNLVGVTIAFSLLNAIFQIAKIDFNVMNYSLEMILGGLSGITEGTTHPGLIRALVVPLCYVIIFVGGGWLVNRRRDV